MGEGCSRFWRKFKHYSIIKRQMLRVVIDFIISYYRHYIHQNWGLPRNQSSRQTDKYFVNFILPFAAEQICPPVHRGTAKITNLKIVKDCSFVINSGAVTMVDFQPRLNHKICKIHQVSFTLNRNSKSSVVL